MGYVVMRMLAQSYFSRGKPETWRVCQYLDLALNMNEDNTGTPYYHSHDHQMSGI